MSRAMLARKSEAEPFANARASSKASSSGLRISEPGDAFEREADRAADESMRGRNAAPVWSLSRMGIEAPLQRKCSCGGSGSDGECEECKEKKAQQRKTAAPVPSSEKPGIVHEVLNSPGRPLDNATRGFFEQRFGHDFSRVRIHTDGEAAASARAVDAQAYAVGQDVVFALGRYAPETRAGQRLLAHELAHVAQQRGTRAASRRKGIGRADATQENEAARASASVMAGARAPIQQSVNGPVLACFSDTQHHIIEEAALQGSGLTEDQIRSVEKGNVQRDYSQMPAALNAALLGKAQNFGGYKPEEHFDNFIYDVQSGRWRTRGAGLQKYLHLDPREPDTSPIDYISSQLGELAQGGLNNDSLVHLGNAFHTVEDFFAHSNFIELTRKVDQPSAQKEDLFTGSFAGESANTAVSLAHTLGAVSPPGMQSYYAIQAEQQTRLTEPYSHSHLAKDTPEAAGFAEARRLAALVIQELAADVVRAMSEHDPGKRSQMMNDIVMAKIRFYLRPPDPKNRWWETMVSRGGRAMDARLSEAEKRTPVTVNQAVFSPLRNLEASKDSPMAIPLGVAVPLGGTTFLQLGGGVTRPSPLDPRLPESADRTDQRSGLFGGAQITGHF